MGKALFEIGENEKHRILVSWSLVSKRIAVELDGEKVLDKFHLSPAPEKFQLDVGNSEKHLVEISAGGFAPVKLTVDGKEFQKS
ncbi:MAG: hypothetical protein QW597_07395 [Thermoplasmataceae archaeon]